jgi:hypothetical protein
MPNLTDDEYTELARLLRQSIDGDAYPLSPRVRRWTQILGKLDPDSAQRTVTPFPAPKPSAEPSLLYARLRGSRRRR